MVAGARPSIYAVLDIGTVEAKALLVLVEGEKAGIVGAGRMGHQPGAIVNGSLADVKIAARACEQALAQAEAQTEVIVGERLVADKALLGISGPSLSSVCRSLEMRRPRPLEAMTENELRHAVQRAERAVLQQARDDLAHTGRQSDAAVGLVDADILHLAVDGERVINSIALKGAVVDVRLSNVLVPKAYLAAFSALANELELEMAAIACGACAVARIAHVTGRGDAIIVDVGGDCTDVLLVRNGGLEAIRTLPLAGAVVTRRVSRTLGIPPAGAEEVKRAYCANRLDQERCQELRTAIGVDVAAWLEALQAALRDMAGHGELPAQVFLCGGGAALPDVQRAARTSRWMGALPFARQPQVAMAQPGLQSNIVDLTHAASGEAYIVPASLAAWLVSSLRPAASGPQRILRQALHGMDLL